MVQAQSSNWWKRRGEYLLTATGVLLSLALMVGTVLFWDEIQEASGYGYLTGFIVSIFGGVTIIPLPSLLFIFTLGSRLNPVYLGFVSGLGESLGGVTVYLTGAGGAALWSKLHPKQLAYYAGQGRPGAGPAPSGRLSSRWWRFYWRLTDVIGRKGAYWALFLSSAFIWWLYYPVALTAGSLRIGLDRFLIISLAGKTIRGLIVAFAGYWGLSVLLRWLGVLY